MRVGSMVKVWLVANVFYYCSILFFLFFFFNNIINICVYRKPFLIYKIFIVAEIETKSVIFLIFRNLRSDVLLFPPIICLTISNFLSFYFSFNL